MAARKRKRTRRNIADQTRSKQPKRAPCVGIFWLVDGVLLIDKTPLSEAEPYANCLNYPRGHNAVWEQYQQIGKVPADVPYEEPPRGRVMFDTTTEHFAVLADKCILKRKGLIAKIRSELSLPTATTVGSDSHYRCSVCLYGTSDEE